VENSSSERFDLREAGHGPYISRDFGVEPKGEHFPSREAVDDGAPRPSEWAYPKLAISFGQRH
jgi:hypothetical protein